MWKILRSCAVNCTCFLPRMYYFSDVKLYSYHTSDKYYSYYVSNNYCIWLVIQAITEFKYNKKNPASRNFLGKNCWINLVKIITMNSKHRMQSWSLENSRLESVSQLKRFSGISGWVRGPVHIPHPATSKNIMHF